MNPETQAAPAAPAPAAPAPKRKKSKGKIVMLLLLVVMMVVAGAFAYLWMQSQSESKKVEDDLNAQIKTLQSDTQARADELEATKAILDKAQIVPAPTDFTPQCDSPNTDNPDILVTPVTTKTIDGYQLFIMDCKKSLAAGKSVARLTGFKVDDSGKFTFAYGATTTEPFCISKTTFGEAAGNLVKDTGLALCKKTKAVI